MELDDTAQCNGVGCKTFQETIIVWNWLLGHTYGTGGLVLTHKKGAAFKNIAEEQGQRTNWWKTTDHWISTFRRAASLDNMEQIVVWPHRWDSFHTPALHSRGASAPHLAPNHMWNTLPCAPRCKYPSTYLPKYQVHMNWIVLEIQDAFTVQDRPIA